MESTIFKSQFLAWKIKPDNKFKDKCSHREIPLGFKGTRSHAIDKGVARTSPAHFSSKRFREHDYNPHPTVLPSCLACWLDRSRLALLRSSHAEEVVKTPSVAAGKSLPRSRCCAAASEQVEGANSMLPLVTFLVHCLTVLINSEMTMSTHFRQGSLIFFTCFFTMVSKAMSGVKRPVLNTQGGDKTRQEGEKGQGEFHSVTHTSWSRHCHHQNPGHLGWEVSRPLDKP